jgi:hypothetical protein
MTSYYRHVKQISVILRFAMFFPKNVTPIANGTALNHVSLMSTSNKSCPIHPFYFNFCVQFYNQIRTYLQEMVVHELATTV